MERARKNLVFLDTHIVIWLYAGLKKKLSKKVVAILNSNELYISPLVLLEIEYLYESKKIKEKSASIIASLTDTLGLRVSQTSFNSIIDVALILDWTRDLFDRLLIAECQVNNAYFISKDKTIRKNYPLAVW